MSETSGLAPAMELDNAGEVVPVLQPVQQNIITLGWNEKKDSRPKELSVLGAVGVFVNRELKRKQDEAARALLTEAQRQAYDLGAWTSYKEFFEDKGIAGFPARGGYQAECRIINDAFQAELNGIEYTGHVPSGKSVKVFVSKLTDVGEKRDYKIVFNEVCETYKNEPKNKYADLLG